MNNKILNVTLSCAIGFVALSLIGGEFLASNTKTSPINTATLTKTPAKVAVNHDTLLSIQSLVSSGCEKSIELDDKKLLALPQQQFVTHHSWSDSAEAFSGPLLQDVLATACSNAEKIKLTALNDYAIDMDFSEVKKYQPIVALSVDGKRLSVREKGPLWVMLPLDKFKVSDRSLDGMMIWQLSDITILKTANNES